MLERRVQVLFEVDEYEQLTSYARTEGQSVGAVVREAVRRTVAAPVSARQAVLDRLLARADASPAQPVGEWTQVKGGFEFGGVEGISRDDGTKSTH
jgi:hypothetical protein